MRDYPKSFSAKLAKKKNLPLYEEGGEVEGAESEREYPVDPESEEELGTVDEKIEEELGTVDEKIEPIEEPLQEHSEEPIKPKKHKPDYFRGLSIKS